VKKAFGWLAVCVLFCSSVFADDKSGKKPIVYVPLGQPELAYNLSKECSNVELTWIVEKAEFVLSWGMNEKENRNDWVLYSGEGKFVSAGETIRVSATARDICRAIK
jgi:hypothetical protein